MPTDYEVLLTLHRTAVLGSIDVVARVTDADLHRPTPCGDWTLRDLLAHMTVQHRGFAAAARGFGADPAHWNLSSVVDPLGSYADAARDALDAFADADADSPFALPEFGPDAVAPGAMAIGFHLVDYVVHGWDVAASLGRAYEVPVDVAAAALTVALAVPDGDFREAEESPFARAVDGPAATDLDRILRRLGRRPEWSLSRTRR